MNMIHINLVLEDIKENMIDIIDRNGTLKEFENIYNELESEEKNFLFDERMHLIFKKICENNRYKYIVFMFKEKKEIYPNFCTFIIKNIRFMENVESYLKYGFGILKNETFKECTLFIEFIYSLYNLADCKKCSYFIKSICSWYVNSSGNKRKRELFSLLRLNLYSHLNVYFS